MALIDSRDLLKEATPQREPLQPQDPSQFQEPEAPSTSEVFGAAFERENPIVSLLSEPDYSEENDPTFNVFDHVPDELLDRSSEFYEIHNLDDFNLKMQDVNRQRENDDILARGGMKGFAAMMIAGTLDPTMAIPGMGISKAVSTGARVSKSAANVAATGGIAIGAQEVVLNSTQSERTLAESAINTSAGLVLGGMLGGAISAATNPGKILAQEIIKENLASGRGLFRINSNNKLELELSASARQNLDAPEIVAINEYVVKVIAGPKVIRGPLLNGLLSKSPIGRSLANNLFDHQIQLDTTLKNVNETAVESLIKLDLARVHKASRDTEGLFKTYTARVKGENGKPLRYDEFLESVGPALRNKDKHIIPEVQQVAEKLRADMVPMIEALQAAGILPRHLDPKTAQSWITRSWNQDTVVARRPELEAKGMNHARRERAKFRAEAENLRATRDRLSQLEKKTADQAEELSDVNEMLAFSKLDDDGLYLDVVETVDSIIGLGSRGVESSRLANHAMKTSPETRLTRKRTWTIPDNEVEEFLDNNGLDLYATFMANASSATHSRQLLKDMGFDGLPDLVDAIKSEGNMRLARATTEKGRLKIHKETITAIQDAKDNLAIMTGTFGKDSKFDSALQVLRMYQTMRLLGGVTLSSLPDIAMSIFRHGAVATVVDGWIPAFKNMMGNDEFRKMSNQNLNDLGVGIEAASASMLNALINADTRSGRKLTGLEKWLGRGSKLYGKLTLLSYWNDTNKLIAGHVASARLIRAITKSASGETLTASEKSFLGTARVPQRFHKEIASNYKRLGGEEQGSPMTNFHLWDEESRIAFGAAVRSTVDSTVLTPGKGDIPAIVQGSEIGKTLFLFKSFMATATTKITISGLQRRDKEVAQGILGLGAMGIFTYIVKEKLAGREPDMSPDNLALQMLIRTGMAGFMGDTLLSNNPWTKNAARYAGGNLLSAIAGPTPAWAEDVAQQVTKGLAGDSKGEHFNPAAFRQLLIGQNLFYTRKLFDEIFGTKGDKK